MVNLPIVNTFTKMNPRKKFQKFFSENCTINLCFNFVVLGTLFITSPIFSTYIINMQKIFFKNIHIIIEVLPPSENLGI